MGYINSIYILYCNKRNYITTYRNINSLKNFSNFKDEILYDNRITMIY